MENSGSVLRGHECCRQKDNRSIKNEPGKLPLRISLVCSTNGLGMVHFLQLIIFASSERLTVFQLFVCKGGEGVGADS